MRSRRSALQRFAGCLLIFSGGVFAAGDGPKVLELFTSHGCSSCPPADRLLGELIEQDPSLIALEFHVDYWNQLQYGSAGNWIDPFSDPAFTQRQVDYDRAGLDGRPGVYTPQVIVNGEFAAVGSDRQRILQQLSRDRGLSEVGLTVHSTPDNQFEVVLSNPRQHEADLWLVVFTRRTTTEVTAGENQGKTIVNHHVVDTVTPVGRTGAPEQRVSVPVTLAAGKGCALLVRDGSVGRFLGAKACPR